MSRRMTWVPEHYQTCESSWRRDSSERIHIAMLDRVFEQARDAHPILVLAIEAYVAANWPAVMWLQTRRFGEELYDAASQRADVSEEQAEWLRLALLDAERKAYGLPHLGKPGVCERCGAPAFDEDGEQPDLCWDGRCKAPGADERYAALLAMTGETLEELERLDCARMA